MPRVLLYHFDARLALLHGAIPFFTHHLPDVCYPRVPVARWEMFADSPEFMPVPSAEMASAMANQAYEKSQNIEEPWRDPPTRSTAIGDVVAVFDEHRVTVLVCAPVGWVDALPVLAGEIADLGSK